jgi:hypothetical protein
VDEGIVDRGCGHQEALKLKVQPRIGVSIHSNVRNQSMKQFRASIWAKDGELGIRPISSIEEAQILLDGWPTTGRSPIYYFTANSMKSATSGERRSPDGRDRQSFLPLRSSA